MQTVAAVKTIKEAEKVKAMNALEEGTFNETDDNIFHPAWHKFGIGQFGAFRAIARNSGKIERNNLVMEQ